MPLGLDTLSLAASAAALDERGGVSTIPVSAGSAGGAGGGSSSSSSNNTGTGKGNAGTFQKKNFDEIGRKNGRRRTHSWTSSSSQ